MPRQHENDPSMSDIAVHRQLASLQTSVTHLADTLKQMTSQWARQEETASAGRKALHEKFEHFRGEVGVQMAGLSLRVDRLVDSMQDMDKTMTKIEPAVKKYEDEKLRQEGAKRLGKGLIAAMTAAAGGIGWGLHELIGYLKPGSLP